MPDWPFIGRVEELELLDRLLLMAGLGAVLVAGEGLGKTRLLHEFMARAASGGFATSIVAGTRAAMAVPLAAVADLLPEDGALPGAQLDVFRAARRVIGTRFGRQPVVLAVDDAHLLDDSSAALVHHLAFTGAVRPLVAVRSAEQVPDAITALWRDGSAQRVDLQPLGLDDVASLLAVVLGSHVEEPTLRRLWKVSGGNPLYLREVTSDAVRAGTLCETDKVWSWRGEVPVGPRLRDLVALRLAGLTTAERALVDLLALGDPLDQPMVSALADAEAQAALERRGLVVSKEVGGAIQLQLDHPVFAEAVRSLMPVGERARLSRVLAESVGPDPRDDMALLRAATWQVDGAVTSDAALLTRGADRANRLFDPRLAERLASAAVAAGAGPEARLVRAEALLRLNRFDEVVELVASLGDDRLDDDQLVRVAIVLAEAAYWGLGRAGDADATLARIGRRVSSDEARQRVVAQRSAAVIAAGDLDGAAALAVPIATDPQGDPWARLRAVTAAGASLCFTGRPADALALCDELLPVAGAHAAAVPIGLGWVLAQRILALTCLGQLADAELVMLPLRELAIAEGDDETIGASSLVLGRLALSRGDVVSADAVLREAAASLRRYDPARYLSWCFALLAQAAGQAGDAARAREALVEAERAVSSAVRIYEFELVSARAWTAVAGGEVTSAGRILLEGAAESKAANNRFGEGFLLHEAMRCGVEPHDVLEDLRAVCAGTDLPLHRLFLAHAEALAARNGRGLEEVADQFESVGLLALAAECAAEASTVHREAGLRSSADRASGRASQLLERCAGVSTPAVKRLGPLADLTRREREVSELAARGLSNAEIADRLCIGVRTVEGHLLRAGMKLGVRGRQQLAEALGFAENA